MALAAGTEDYERVKAEAEGAAAASSEGASASSSSEAPFAATSDASTAALGAAATEGAMAGSQQDAAVDLLKRLPGVTAGNLRTITKTVHSVAELAALSLEQLGAFLDARTAGRIFDFLHGKIPPGGV